MKRNRRRLLFAAVLAVVLAIRHVFAVGLIPRDLTTATPTGLVDTLRGPGILSVSNISYTGSNLAAGTFTGGNGIVGFDSGVVLGTGRMTSIVGPNFGAKVSRNNGTGGDQNLTGLARQLSGDQTVTTLDASVLEFDFVPDKDRVFFRYVFASVEYNQYVNTKYNDVLAFYVNGVNCATVDPGHTVPVSVNTVNGGPLVAPVPPSQFFTLDTTKSSHPELFLNNDFQTGANRPGGFTGLNIAMDGLTKVLTCKAAVIANQVNHVKLAIADVADRFLDSNVFLQTASFTTTPPITIVKKTNGTNYDVAPTGPFILVGSDVRWTYEVTNSGTDPLSSVTVTDKDNQSGNNLAVTCPKTTLSVGESMTCSATGTAIKDQYNNFSTATAISPIIGDVSDSSLGHYFGADPHIKIVKKTDGASHPTLFVADPVTWTYEVTNTGNVDLSAVSVTDSKGVIVDCSLLPGGLPKTDLAKGNMMVCSASGTVEQGEYENTGTASGKVDTVTVNGTVNPVTVTDHNDGHYFGANPKLTIVKTTNGTNNNAAPGPLILVGDQVKWTYAVTNTGNVALSGVVVTDDPAGSVCAIDSLAVGASSSCEKLGTAQKGAYENTGKASVTFTGTFKTKTVTDQDTDHYFGADPKLVIVTKTNATDNDAAPGPFILVGDPVLWTYAVANTGNVPLTDVAVTDDKAGAICAIGPLAVGATASCQKPATAGAQKGQYENTGAATGNVRTLDVTGQLKTVTPTGNNLDHYFGADPKITILTKTDGTNNDLAPGPFVLVGDPVLWTYAVTNTGNVPLADVAVIDDKVGAICSIGPLAVNASASCQRTGSALRDQYENTGGSSGKLAVSSLDGQIRTVTITASNIDHYFGADPRIAIIKRTNGTDNDLAPGLFILVDRSLEYHTSAYGSETAYHGDASEHEHDHDGARDGKDADRDRGDGRDRDDDRSFKDAHDEHRGPDEDHDKDKDHSPPPLAIWTYAVTNIGNVPLTNVIVIDDKAGPICAVGPLAVAASASCTKTGIAQKGQYENTGTASGQTSVMATNGQVRLVSVAASNVDHYFGADPRIKIVKKTNGTDNNNPRAGCQTDDDHDSEHQKNGEDDKHYSFSRSGSQGHDCEDDFNHSFGGDSKGKKTDDRDERGKDEHGNQSSHESEKDDDDNSLGPMISVGSTVTWTYEVTNIGNVTLANVTVTDSDESLVVTCPRTTLPPLPNPAATMICSASGRAIEGQYENIGTARGTLVGPILANGNVIASVTVSDQDEDHYFGVKSKSSGKDNDRGGGKDRKDAKEDKDDKNKGKGDDHSKGEESDHAKAEDHGKDENRRQGKDSGKGDDRGKGNDRPKR